MVMNKRYCVIMAGGVGSRFWPISRTAKPKQFLDILGTGKSFIRHTFERFLPLVPVENFLVVTNESYRGLVLEQIPELRDAQVLGEPIGRNTAPCIAWAAYKLLALDPGAEMIVTPSDHLILNEKEFAVAIEECAGFAHGDNALMTIGIKPNRPDTGYGYIQVEKDRSSSDIKKVKTFTEKPDLEMAKVFVESGEFFWNSGIFIWKAKAIRDALVSYLPDTAQLFASINGAYNTSIEKQSIERVYSECKPISIDFGVMEKASNVYVRCSDFGWSDVGTWGSLYQNSEKDSNGNVLGDNVMTYNTRNCIIKTPEETLTVVEGLENYIVVRSGDVVMICPKANEQNIKRFIDDVKYSRGERFI
jgi:mannose-1-phosphate guanylyltransferase